MQREAWKLPDRGNRRPVGIPLSGDSEKSARRWLAFAGDGQFIVGRQQRCAGKLRNIKWRDMRARLLRLQRLMNGPDDLLQNYAEYASAIRLTSSKQ
jgi:hypothetical protein